MPPVKSERSCKLQQWIEGDPSFSTDGKTVFCELCRKEVKCEKKFQIDQHRKTSKHQARAGQVGHLSKERGHFNAELCDALLKADMPLSKVDDETFRDFLKKHCRRDIPSEITLMNNCMQAAYERVLRKIREDIRGSPIWISVGEATDPSGKYMAYVFVGKCHPNYPGKPYLLLCKHLEKANQITIVRTVQEALGHLWNQPGREEERKVLALLTDASDHFLEAGETLKVFYPDLIHVTCAVHALNRVAEQMRAMCPEVNALISSVAEVFWGAASRAAAFSAALPELPKPPIPEPAKIGAWIAAATYYSKHYHRIKQVLKSMDDGEDQVVLQSQKILESSSLPPKLAELENNFACLFTALETLSGDELDLRAAVKVVEGVEKNEWTGQVGRAAAERLENVMRKNPGWDTVKNAATSLMAEEDTKEGLSHKSVACLKFLPITCCRADMALPDLLWGVTGERKNLTGSSLNRYVVVKAYDEN